MQWKKLITVALLTLVAVGLLASVARRLRPPSQACVDSGSSNARDDRLLVYFLRGKVRCTACDQIEAGLRKTLASDFADEVRSGRIEFLQVDYSLTGHEHFVEEFQLVATSVVLVELRDGQSKRWKNLADVWTMADRPEAVCQYLQEEIRSFLN